MTTTKARKGNVLAWPETTSATGQPGSGLASFTSTRWKLGVVQSCDRAGTVKTATELHYGSRTTFKPGQSRYVVDSGKIELDLEKLTAAYAELHQRGSYRPLRTAEDVKALVLRFTLAGNPS